MSGDPKRVQIDKNTIVHVGRTVHLTRDDIRSLESLSERMRRLSFHHKPGFFAEFVECHNHISAIIRAKIEESHRSMP